MTGLILHGKAVTFEKTVAYDGGFLCVAKGAFDRFLAAPDHHVALRWGAHDAEIVATTQDRSLRLFADNVGLWFKAIIADPMSRRCGSITRTLLPLNQASVDFVVRDERADVWLGTRRCLIKSAGADHISLTHRGAFGQHTAVWAPLAGLERASERIRNLEQQFQEVCAVSSTREFAFALVGRNREKR